MNLVTISPERKKVDRRAKPGTDFAEKFEKVIASYNAGGPNIEELFEELVKLSRPAPELSADERAEVKKVARELLTKPKLLLVLNWGQKSTARSQLKLPNEDVLDTGLPRAYGKPLYEQKCSALFEAHLRMLPGAR